MIVEQPEHLRAWLSQVLQPLCDADPNALAKYVIALVKKDRDEGELRHTMKEQLDVFLQSQTEPFVNRLFTVLQSKEYLSANPPFKPPSDVLELDIGATSDIAESEGSITGKMSDHNVVSSGHKSVGGSGAAGNKSSSKKEEDDRDRTRSRRKVGARSPPSHRDTQGRTYTNNENRYSANDNDHKFTRSWADRNRRPPIRPRRRSRSRPRTRRHRHDYGSRSRSPVSYSYNDSSKSKDANSSTTQKGGRDAKDTTTGSGTTNTTKPSTTKQESSGEEQTTTPTKSSNRCRDFDEKGLCLRGDLCPYDHGVNPLVLEESLKNEYRMQLEMQDGFPSRIVRVGPPAYGPGVDLNHPWPPQGFGPRAFMDGRGPRGPPMVQYPSPQVVPRLLVDIPAIGGVPPPQNEMMGMDMSLRGMPRHPGRGFYMGGRGGRGRGGFDRGRLGLKTFRSNCSLQVKKIPVESNNIMALNGHFSKFGKIINIQINFENDPEAALVTFSAPEEAFQAYKSTEAVLNNRFIRVYWHNKEKENEDGDGTGRVSVKDRLGEHADMGEKDDGKLFPPGETFLPIGMRKDPSAERQEKVEAIKKSQEMLAAQETLRKALEEKKKETLKLMNNLKIRKRDILKEHLEHQKKLIKKLETEEESMAKEEKEQLLGLITRLQETIEKIKTEIDGTRPIVPTTDVPVLPTTASVMTNPRDILDAELDMYKDQDGSISSELKRKSMALQPKLPAKRGRGGGVFRNSHVGSFNTVESNLSLRSVDRRTTTICVSGYDPSAYDEVLTHFNKYGSISASEPLAGLVSVKVTFSNRKEAELAKSNGKVFAGRALDIKWVDKLNAEKKYPNLNSSNGSNAQVEETDENRLSDDEEGEPSAGRFDQLYDPGDEDEEQDGERSWRR